MRRRISLFKQAQKFKILNFCALKSYNGSSNSSTVRPHNQVLENCDYDGAMRALTVVELYILSNQFISFLTVYHPLIANELKRALEELLLKKTAY